MLEQKKSDDPEMDTIFGLKMKLVELGAKKYQLEMQQQHLERQMQLWQSEYEATSTEMDKHTKMEGKK